MRCNSCVTDQEVYGEVRRLRATGMSPKGIARTLGVRPAAVAPIVRELAAETPPQPPEHRELVGCWISPAWSRELIVEPREGWDDVDVGPDGPAGIALVLVARAGRGDRVSVCGYLVDTFCLGVKDVIGPELMRKRQLPSFSRAYFVAFPGPALHAPVELAQHLVHGAVAFAAGLGFAPHPDFPAARGHLGELNEPCAFRFGRQGRPLYVPGPYDDPFAVMQALKETVGSDGFAVAA